MKILFSAPNEDLSICRYHEAFRGGLRRMFDTRFFGQGYAGYDPGVKSYKDILGRLFPNDSPDLVIIADINYTSKLKDLQLAYDDLDAAHCAKGLIVSDFWHITNNYLDGFVDWIEKHDIRYVLCQMPGCLEAFAHTRAADRFVLMPICIDPAMFNDWNLPKKYDIGFLGKGVLDNDRFYPERQAIHAKLNKMGLNYLTAQHPGYGRIPDDHPVGAKNFAYLINSCRIHVVTGSRYNNPFGKYFETMASNAMLMGTEPMWSSRFHLVDGVNYVKIAPDDVEEKVRYYLARPELCEKIAREGYRTAMRYHTGYARACDLYDLVSPAIGARADKTVVHINKHETHGLDLKTLGSQYERQNYGEVLSSLKQFVAQTPTHPFMDQVHLTISECLAHLGQAAESRQAMREIEKLSAAGPTPDWIVEPFESEDDLMTWFHIPGSSYRHLPIVYCLAVGLKAKRIVDLGIGSTTRALRLAAAQTGGTVSSCDFAKARFAHLATKQDATWSLYLGPSGEFLRQIEGPIDFVMHDAAHDYNQVRQDLELLLPKMRRFGIICIHDTQLAELGNGMLAALTDATRNFETSFTTLPFGCGLTILRMESGAFPNLPVGDYLPDGKTLLTQPIPHPMSPLAAPCAA